MSIEKQNTIDYISEESGKKVLSISDYLQWGSASHLYMLQEKINMYLSAIENGQLTTYYPHATNGFLISLYLKYEPDEQGVAFLCNVKDFLNDLGHDFRFTVLA